VAAVEAVLKVRNSFRFHKEFPHMKMHWFVLHTLSGQEFKVKENIDKRLQIEEMQDLVEQVLIPTEKVSEVKDGKKRELTRKFYPGYVLAHMALYNDDHSVNERTWHFIQQTPGIIGFVGGEKPAPLRKSEVDQILNQIEEKKDTTTPKISYEVGEVANINDGPFENFNGTVTEIRGGNPMLSVSIFERTVPVELEY